MDPGAVANIFHINSRGRLSISDKLSGSEVSELREVNFCSFDDTWRLESSLQLDGLGRLVLVNFSTVRLRFERVSILPKTVK